MACIGKSVVRTLLLSLLLLSGLLPATTLEKLSFDEMVAKSTRVVRGRVSLSAVRAHGSVYYSHYTVAVSETYKGGDVRTLDVVLPGGTIGKSQQTFAGVPALAPNADLVLFLWTSPSGMTHVLGLTQGIFRVTKDSDGKQIYSRDAISEGMVNARTGRPESDSGMRFTAEEFAQRVRQGVRQ